MNVRKLREKLFHLDDQNQSAIEAVLILIPELSAERDELLEALKSVTDLFPTEGNTRAMSIVIVARALIEKYSI